MKSWIIACAGALAVAVVLITGLGAAPRDPPDAPGLVHFRLGAVDGHTLNPDADDYASRPEAGRSASTGPLLLFLPATRATPASYRSFLRTATSVGYHVLGLDYWNIGTSVTHACGPNPACYTVIQQNRFNGTHPSSYSRVDAANSIVDRLHRALRYLGRHDRNGHWMRYTDGPRIRWTRIVLAGHSQGGGESAYIAHRTRVQGALMFSAPVDTYGGVAASWMGAPGKTKPSRLYAFDNVHDMYYRRISGSWRRLGLAAFGQAVRSAVPTGSHELIATNTVGDAEQTHGRTVSDQTPRVHDGVAGYRPVWEWMLKQVLRPQPPASGVHRVHSGS